MRILLLALLFWIVPGAAAAQWLGPPRSQRLANPLLTQILIGGTQRHIEGVDGDEKPPIFVRLYATPIPGDCVPRTRENCSFRYYLALSDDAERPNQSVFLLGALGEVTRAELLTSDGGPPARLRLTVAPYPSWVLERRPELRRPPMIYTIQLAVDRLTVTRQAAAPELRPQRIVGNPLLVRVLNDLHYGDIDGLGDEGEPPPIIPTLYDVPEEVECPPMRRRFACASRHFLALNVAGWKGGRRPRQVVFDLGLLGEVTNADFSTTNGSEPLKLRLRVVNYPSWVFDGENPPRRQEAVYNVVLDPDVLRITRER